MSEAPLVDCHAHVWDASVPFAADAWTRPDYCYTAEDFLADMDRQKREARTDRWRPSLWSST